MALTRKLFVSQSVRSKAVVTVADRHGPRQFRRHPFLEFFDLRVQTVDRRSVLGRDTIRHGIDLHTDRRHLVREQLLAVRPLRLGRPDGDLNLFGKALQLLFKSQLAVGLFQTGDLLFQWLDLGIDFRFTSIEFRDFLRRRKRELVVHKREKGRQHTVVVMLEDRVKLVIVAPRAVYRQAHESAARSADHVVEIVVAVLRIVLLAKPDRRPDAVESGGNQRLVRNFIQLVSRQLFKNELVVRLVVVESLYYVIAVPPGVRVVVVMLIPAAVGVTRHIEPMAAPALPVMP